LHSVVPDDPSARRDHLAALLLIAGAGVVAGVLGIFVFSHLLDRSDVRRPAEVALATEGKAVYAVSCRTCHGANLGRCELRSQPGPATTRRDRARLAAFR
jgi:mono/diheme cytochrome c family protein